LKVDVLDKCNVVKRFVVDVAFVCILNYDDESMAMEVAKREFLSREKNSMGWRKGQ